MSKSLAHVAILISTVAFSANAGAADQKTSPPAAVKNHISDAERDRLMQDAMEKARKQLEETKAQREAREKVQAEQEALRNKEKIAEVAGEKRAEEKKAEQAAAAKKAEEVRLANQLAEAEKKSSEKSEKSDEVKNLDDKKTEQASSSKKSDDSDKTDSDESESKSKSSTKVATSKNSDDSEKDSKKESTDKNRDDESPRKTVIETVSTRQPGEGLSVKTTMPAGDSEREAEQRAARERAGSGDPGSRSSDSSESHSYSGRVVGLMRGANGETKILMQADDRRMVQVVIGDNDVPAPGSVVSIRGRAIGGNRMSPVIDAESVDIKSGQKMKPMRDVQPPAAAAPVLQPEMVMPPPMPMLGPPLPMGPGIMPPGPMIGAPPPF